MIHPLHSLGIIWFLTFLHWFELLWQHGKETKNFSQYFWIEHRREPKAFCWSKRNLVLSRITYWMAGQERQRRERSPSCWCRDLSISARVSWFTTQRTKETIKKKIPTRECTKESRLLSTFREEGFIQELAKNNSQVCQTALHQPPLNYHGWRRPGTLAKQRRGRPSNPVYLALGFSAKAWEFLIDLGPNPVWIASCCVNLGKSFHLSEPQIPYLESGASYIPSPGM